MQLAVIQISTLLKQESGLLSTAYSLANKLELSLEHHRVSITNWFFWVHVNINFIVIGDSNDIVLFEETIRGLE